MPFALVLALTVAQNVHVFETDGDRSKLNEKSTLTFASQPAAANSAVITVDDSKTYQTIDGFGASMTHSAAAVISQLPKAGQREVLRMLFHEAGISLVRQPMGASDFSARGNYSYQETEGGAFSIAPDEEAIVPLLKQASAIGAFRIIAVPWSAPGWMKSGGSMNGGTLLESRYGDFAQYFVHFVAAYKAAGLPIYAVAMQNEPLFQTPNYPSTLVTAAEQAAFLGQYLGPALKDSGTKILAYDHNWDHAEYPDAVLNDGDAASYVAGTAFHCYAGDVAAQLALHVKHPDKDIWFTECSGTVGSSFAGDLAWNARNLVIESSRNWSRGTTLWNMALDAQSGPKNGGCEKCRGVLTIDPVTRSITPNVEFYLLAQVAKHVRPGAVRVDSNESGTLRNVAFRNTDGTMAVVVLNDSNAAASFAVSWNGKSVTHVLPGQSVATLVWRAP